MVSALIERSGLETGSGCAATSRPTWFRWCIAFTTYELAFMPHGENVILILENGVPVSAIMKDIAEEIVVMGERLDLPEEVGRIKVEIPDEEKVLAIFTDVFDCIFRFLSALLEEDGKLSGEDFWRTAAAVVRSYQDEHPELAEQFARHDLSPRTSRCLA